MMRLRSFLFLCAMIFQVCGVFCVNLPIPGTHRADALRAHGIAMLAPSEPVVASMDEHLKLTVTMDEATRLFFDTVLAVPLNLLFAFALLRVASYVLSGLPHKDRAREPRRVTALSRAGM